MASSKQTLVGYKYAEFERDVDRLRRTTAPDVTGVELVSAFAGDRVMTAEENARLRAHRRTRGKVFFSDIIYAVSHHYVAPDVAEVLWKAIIAHKHKLSTRLGRNVRIAVATLDYLSNITNELSSPTLIAESYVSEMAKLSMRDGMTGLFNHTSCYELLDLEFRIHRRYGEGVSLILLDIDDFKSFNDRFGHQVGDRILVQLADTMRRAVRDSDICCRIGGEEFVAILPLTSEADEAWRVAERIRHEASRITCGAHRITVSVGVSTCDHRTSSPRALIEEADRALYRAKTAGKNQVMRAEG